MDAPLGVPFASDEESDLSGNDSDSDSATSGDDDDPSASIGGHRLRPRPEFCRPAELCARLLCSGATDEEIMLCQQHQRSLAAAAISLFHGQDSGGGWQCRHHAFDWEAHVHNLNEDEFKARYRLSAQSFYKLLELLRPELDVNNHLMASRSRSGRPIPIEARLACALRYFAGGDPIDLKLIYCMSKQQIMLCVWRAVDAINLCLDNIIFPIDDIQALGELERDFRAGTRGGFWQGQVGAIDGVHFKMKCPTAQVKDPMRYYIARKQEFALLAIAICDYHRRFTYVDISHASQTHDSTAWAATDLGVRVARGDLPYPFFLNGDGAFPLGPNMIVPSTGDASLDNFDFYQSSTRMAIECAFGILIRRWGLLWRSLECSFHRAHVAHVVPRMHGAVFIIPCGIYYSHLLVDCPDWVLPLGPLNIHLGCMCERYTCMQR